MKEEILLYITEDDDISTAEIMKRLQDSLKSKPQIPLEAEIRVWFVPYRLLFVARWSE